MSQPTSRYFLSLTNHGWVNNRRPFYCDRSKSTLCLELRETEHSHNTLLHVLKRVSGITTLVTWFYINADRLKSSKFSTSSDICDEAMDASLRCTYCPRQHRVSSSLDIDFEWKLVASIAFGVNARYLPSVGVVTKVLVLGRVGFTWLLSCEACSERDS